MPEPGTRPRNAASTRERILAAARHEFARQGFDTVTVRAIADLAGVSPNLITRYFGGKEGLFVAATELRLGLESRLDGPRCSLGRRLADSIVARWTTITGDDPLLAMLRAAGGRPEAAEALAGFLDREALQPLKRQFLSYGMPDPEAEARARAIDVFVLGISARYRMLRQDLGEPDALANWIAGTVQLLVDNPWTQGGETRPEGGGDQGCRPRTPPRAGPRNP